MLEILIIIFGARKASEVAGEKGCSGFLFGLLFVVCWIGCEILGFVLGLGLYGNKFGAYGLAVLGAFGGGILPFLVLAVMPEVGTNRFDSMGRYIAPKSRSRRRAEPRRERREDDRYTEKPRRRREEIVDLVPVDDEEILDVEEVRDEPPRKAQRRVPPRRPSSSRDRYRSDD
jgi:hypothetical protein